MMECIVKKIGKVEVWIMTIVEMIGLMFTALMVRTYLFWGEQKMINFTLGLVIIASLTTMWVWYDSTK